jgi:hypothetical protein
VGRTAENNDLFSTVNLTPFLFSTEDRHAIIWPISQRKSPINPKDLP